MRKLATLMLALFVLIGLSAGCYGTGDEGGTPPTSSNNNQNNNQNNNNGGGDGFTVGNDSGGLGDIFNGGADTGSPGGDTSQGGNGTYAGTWVTGEGMGTLDCGTSPTDLTSGAEGTITKKSGNMLEFEMTSSSSGATCTLDFTIGAEKATIVSGQSCEQTSNMTTTTITPSEWELIPDGDKLQQSYKSTMTIEGEMTTNCDIEWSGTLVKE